MGLFDKANEIAVLAGGRRAEWLAQAITALAQGAGSGVPNGAGAGVACKGASKTLVILDLRADQTTRKTAYTVTGAPDFGAVYAINIDGTRVDFDASGGATTLAEIIQGLADAINADGTLGPLVLAVATDTTDDSAVDTVIVTGKTSAHYTVNFSPGLTGGPNTGVLACVAEPDNADLRMWATAGGLSGSGQPASTTWRLMHAAEFMGIDALGFVERFDTASLDRLFGEVDAVSGTGDVAKTTYLPGRLVIGPSTLPTV